METIRIYNLEQKCTECYLRHNYLLLKLFIIYYLRHKYRKLLDIIT